MHSDSAHNAFSRCLLQCDQNGDKPLPFREPTQGLADHSPERPERILCFHRVTGCRRGREEIAHLNRAKLRVDFAEDFAHQRNWLAVLGGTMTIQYDTRLIVASARYDTRDALVIGVPARRKSTYSVEHHDRSRIHCGCSCYIKVFRAVGIGQPDVAGDLNVAFKESREVTTLAPNSDTRRACP